jgi:hypothetical protein
LNKSANHFFLFKFNKPTLVSPLQTLLYTTKHSDNLCGTRVRRDASVKYRGMFVFFLGQTSA